MKEYQELELHLQKEIPTALNLLSRTGFVNYPLNYPLKDIHSTMESSSNEILSQHRQLMHHKTTLRQLKAAGLVSAVTMAKRIQALLAMNKNGN